MKVLFFFSFRSPFAGVALYRMRRLSVLANIEIELMPVWPDTIFGGHMDNPTDNLFKMAYIFTDAARQAELAGMDSKLLRGLSQNFVLKDGVDYSSQKLGVPMGEENWALSHVGQLYANDAGKGWEFADLMFQRRFSFDGMPPVDLQQPEVVGELAQACGLDPLTLITACEDEKYQRRIDLVSKSSERYGVFGVPFFVLQQGNTEPETFWGNDRIEYLVQRIQGTDQLPVLSSAVLNTVQR